MESESEGGQKTCPERSRRIPSPQPPFLPVRSFNEGGPFCPPERSVSVLPREARQWVSFSQKMFEQSCIIPQSKMWDAEHSTFLIVPEVGVEPTIP